MADHFDVFHELEHEKKERIINAALEEIAQKGFKKASTNAIVEAAGISKGTLFYYFGSKEALFNFLCDFTMEFAKREYIGKIESRIIKIDDFIERYRMLTKIKRNIMAEHPKIIKFYESFFIPGNEEYFEKYIKTIKEQRENIAKSLYENIDYSLFRDDIAPEKTLKYIIWLLERYEKEVTQDILNSGLDGEAYEEKFKEFEAFLDDLKKIFYK